MFGIGNVNWGAMLSSAMSGGKAAAPGAATGAKTFPQFGPVSTGNINPAALTYELPPFNPAAVGQAAGAAPRQGAQLLSFNAVPLSGFGQSSPAAGTDWKKFASAFLPSMLSGGGGAGGGQQQPPAPMGYYGGGNMSPLAPPYIRPDSIGLQPGQGAGNAQVMAPSAPAQPPAPSRQIAPPTNYGTQPIQFPMQPQMASTFGANQLNPQQVQTSQQTGQPSFWKSDFPLMLGGMGAAMSHSPGVQNMWNQFAQNRQGRTYADVANAMGGGYGGGGQGGGANSSPFR